MQHEPSTTLRLTLLSLVVVGLLVALFSRLWFLQVLAGERYSELADRNRVRFVVTEAARGRILDRNGQELVKNRPALTVSAYKSRLLDAAGQPRDAEARAVLDRLAALLDVPVDDILERLTSRRYSPFRAVPIEEDVSPEVLFTIQERRELFPGVEAETLPVRAYPHGTLAAHLVGYVGEIDDAELQRPAFRDYRPGDLVGKDGLEKSYERWLQGQEGLEQLEVNARGTVLRRLHSQPPQPGKDLTTTLDLDLQRATEQFLADGILASRNVRREDGRQVASVAGAAVVLQPHTGEVLAMASWPTYDPRLFVGGISTQDWRRLTADERQYPLLNRAIQSAFPPGSIWKIVSAASAMETGFIDPDATLPCPRVWRLGDQRFRNWSYRDEGSMDVAEALKRSCDTFFYELALRQWLRERAQEKAGQPVDEAMQRMAHAFGFGAPLGIDLPGEQGGIVPDREWRHAIWLRSRDAYCQQAAAAEDAYLERLYRDLCEYGGRWRGGDSVNMSIGQGDVLATPLQVAAAFAAVANGGTVMRPHVGLQVADADGDVVERVEPESLGRVPVTREQLAEIRLGLEKVVMEDRGTAADAFSGFPFDRVPVAGKTGTAEFGNRIPTAWFAAYAPAHEPRYVVAVMVEEGSGGSVTAAPIARRILEAAFDLPVSRFRAGPATD